MSKKNHGLQVTASINGQELSGDIVDAILGNNEENKRPYEIVEAHLKDSFCNYTYQVTKGIGMGEKHKVDGGGMVKDDLEHLFGRLKVHFAAIDGIFLHSATEVDDIDNFHAHDLTDLYHVTGIKIYGTEENEMVVLLGSKRVMFVGGRSNWSTPRIPLDKLSSYTWHNELAELVARIREEVSLYKEGNYIMPEQDEDHSPKKKGFRQLTIADGMVDATADSDNSDDDEHTDDSDFENARQ